MSGQMFGIETGMSVGALITTTCLAAAFGSLLMGLWAKYPIGLAPGMGQNFFVVLTVMPICATVLGSQVGDAAVWQLALGTVFISGVLFAILSFMNIRKILIDAISPSLRGGISAGIGLFIALIGLQQAGVVVSENGFYVLGMLTTTKCLVFFTGLIITGVLLTLRFRGALLYGIIIAALLTALLGQITPVMPFGLPADPRPLIGQVNVVGVSADRMTRGKIHMTRRQKINGIDGQNSNTVSSVFTAVNQLVESPVIILVLFDSMCR